MTKESPSEPADITTTDIAGWENPPEKSAHINSGIVPKKGEGEIGTLTQTETSPYAGAGFYLPAGRSLMRHGMTAIGFQKRLVFLSPSYQKGT